MKRISRKEARSRLIKDLLIIFTVLGFLPPIITVLYLLLPSTSIIPTLIPYPYVMLLSIILFCSLIYLRSLFQQNQESSSSRLYKISQISAIASIAPTALIIAFAFICFTALFILIPFVGLPAPS